MIEIKNITKVYGKKHNTFTALKDVSLTIPTGSSVAMTWPAVVALKPSVSGRRNWPDADRRTSEYAGACPGKVKRK